MRQKDISSKPYKSRILSGLNLNFILHFLLFSFLPLVIFSVFGYLLNKKIIRDIHANHIEHIAQAVIWRLQDQLNNERMLLSQVAESDTTNPSKAVQTYLLNQKRFDEVYLYINNTLKPVRSDAGIDTNVVLNIPPEKTAGLVMMKSRIFLYFRPDDRQVWLVKPSPKYEKNYLQSPDPDLSFHLVPADTVENGTMLPIRFDQVLNDEPDGDTSSFFQKIFNVERITVSLPVDDNIDLYVRQSTAGMFGALRSFLIDIIIANAFIGILIIILAILLSRKITGPIHALINAVQKIGKGELNQPIQVKSRHEIRTLANEFEKMRQKLQESYTNLETKIEERTNALREAQFQISHQEKMASLGLLAAGIAHEIGNPLTSISSMAQIIKRKSKDNQIIEYLDTILMNINRISKIVRELVDFARPSSYEASFVDVNQLIQNAVNIVKYDRRAKRIELQLQLEDQLPQLYIVADQLLQVFINILINAVDALTEKNPLIEIHSYKRDEYLFVEFRDHGIGIPEENIGKIFEPFYTTKKVGKGTGLGLSVSYGIIKNLNGSIEVKSKVGEGSTFTIKLPLNPNGDNV